MCRQKTFGNFHHVGLPFFSEAYLEYHEVVELVSGLKDGYDAIDATLITSHSSGILQAHDIT